MIVLRAVSKRFQALAMGGALKTIQKMRQSSPLKNRVPSQWSLLPFSCTPMIIVKLQCKRGGLHIFCYVRTIKQLKSNESEPNNNKFICNCAITFYLLCVVSFHSSFVECAGETAVVNSLRIVIAHHLMWRYFHFISWCIFSDNESNSNSNHHYMYSTN